VNAIPRLQSYLRACLALKSVNLRGLPLLPKKFFDAPLHNRRAYNEFLTWIISLELKSVDWVIDVGANHGDFAEAATRVFPGTNILLIEPFSELHGELQRRCDRRKGKWQMEKLALGSDEAVLPLYVAAGEDEIASLVGFSSEYCQVNPQTNIASQLCTVRPLDAVVVEKKISTIDLLKIDVEGFEFEVLRGAARTLQNTRALIVEVSLVRAATGTGNLLASMLMTLTGFGFDIVNVIPSFFDAVQKWRPVEFNVLARRSNASRL
jgi:FkbM family methyltransferase